MDVEEDVLDGEGRDDVDYFVDAVVLGKRRGEEDACEMGWERE